MREDLTPPGRIPSTELYRSFFRLCSIGLCSSDTETSVITLANPALCNMLGYREDEIVGATLWKFLHPDDLASATETFRRAIAQRQNFSPENRLIRRDGSVIVARFNITFLQVDDQNALWTVATVEDITEQRQREHLMRVNEQRLADVLAMARMGNWTWDISSNLQWWSDAEFWLLGLDPATSTASHANFLEITHPEDQGWVEENFQAVVAGSDVYAYDTRVILPNGQIRWLHTMARVVRDGDGNLVQLLGTDQDISDRKATEEQLRTSEQRLQQLADAMPQVVWIATAHGRLLYTNQRGKKLFGERATEDPANLLHPEDGANTKSQWTKSFAERSTFEVELRLKHDDSSYRWFLVRGVPILDTDNSIECWYGTATDIHQIKATEQALREQRERFWQSQKMEAIGRLAGGIAHDFNNLLTIVLGECEMMLEGLQPDVPTKLLSSLHAIQDAGLRASGLTKQLLTFGRRDCTKTESLNLNRETQLLSNLLERMAGDTITIRYDFSTATPWVRTDRTRIEQVLFNLVGNAVDAMPSGGLIRVQTSVLAKRELIPSDQGQFPSGVARIRIIDTGCGFSEEFAEQIFEPFFTTKDVGRGTGLGLAVVHGIIEQLGGRVFAASKTGETTFTLLLPLSKPDHPSANEN